MSFRTNVEGYFSTSDMSDSLGSVRCMRSVVSITNETMLLGLICYILLDS